MKIETDLNPWFRPAPSSNPGGVLDEKELVKKGLYAYINAAHDPELKKQADAIFGRKIPFDNSESQVFSIGQSWCYRSGYRGDPVRYCRDNGLVIPRGWNGENLELYDIIGRDFISRAQADYRRKKAEEEREQQEAATLQPEEVPPPAEKELSGWHLFAFCGLAVLALVCVGWVLWFVAVALLSLRDWVVRWVRARAAAAGRALPVLWGRATSPEAMRGLFLVMVLALVLIAMCLVVIACVFVF